jgi:hypothetical protein
MFSWRYGRRYTAREAVDEAEKNAEVKVANPPRPDDVSFRALYEKGKGLKTGPIPRVYPLLQDVRDYLSVHESERLVDRDVAISESSGHRQEDGERGISRSCAARDHGRRRADQQNALGQPKRGREQRDRYV